MIMMIMMNVTKLMTVIMITLTRIIMIGRHAFNLNVIKQYQFLLKRFLMTPMMIMTQQKQSQCARIRYCPRYCQILSQILSFEMVFLLRLFNISYVSDIVLFWNGFPLTFVRRYIGDKVEQLDKWKNLGQLTLYTMGHTEVKFKMVHTPKQLRWFIIIITQSSLSHIQTWYLSFFLH